MRKDTLLTAEDKIAKRKRIEENRHLRFVNANPEMTDTGCRSVSEQSTDANQIIDCLSFLNDRDRTCLEYVQGAYRSAMQSTPSASSVISFDPSINKTLSITTATEIDTFAAIKLINFLRLLRDFESLAEDDRVSLVKYNLVLLLVLRDVLLFDRKNQLHYDDDIHDAMPCVREKFAHCCRSLYILFYGYEETQFYMSSMCRIVDSLDNDRLVIQLLMIILIFQKGASINDEDAWALLHADRVLQLHLQYVDLLFRYLIDRYSFDVAVVKMVRLVEIILQIQTSARRYQELVRTRDDGNLINPLMKSIMGITENSMMITSSNYIPF